MTTNHPDISKNLASEAKDANEVEGTEENQTEALHRNASLVNSVGAPSLMTGKTQNAKFPRNMSETMDIKGDTMRASVTVKAKAESNIPHGESQMNVVESREDLSLIHI